MRGLEVVRPLEVLEQIRAEQHEPHALHGAEARAAERARRGARGVVAPVQLLQAREEPRQMPLRARRDLGAGDRVSGRAAAH